MAESDTSRSPAALIVFIIGTILCTISIVLRVYTRCIILRSFGKDDAVMVAGWVFCVLTATAMITEYSFGMGKHMSAIPKTDLVPYMKAFFTSTITYTVAIYLVKISIVLQYCRIFQDTAAYRTYYWIMMALSFWTILVSLLLTFVCVPINSFWDTDAPGTCMNKLALWLAVAVINMITDLICFIAPIPQLMKLKMPKNQKILIAGVFGLALCPCILSAYRITTLLALANSTDPAFDNYKAAIWTFLELSIGLVAACLPTLRPILAKIIPSLFTYTSQSGTGNYGEPHLSHNAITLQSSNAIKKGKCDTESTRELGVCDQDGSSTWDNDEVSVNQSSHKDGGSFV